MPLDTLPEPLLDYLARQAGYRYLSDLRFMDRAARRHIVQMLNDLSPEAANLPDWNAALHYLVQAPPEQTEENARARLIAALSEKE